MARGGVEPPIALASLGSRESAIILESMLTTAGQGQVSPASCRLFLISDLKTWAGSGFALLVAIVGFFSIKEGALDRVLRTDPWAALFIFVLIGAGVVCALVCAAVKKDANGRVWLLISIAFALAGALFWLLYGVAAARMDDQTLRANATGDIAETLSFPVDPAEWRFVAVHFNKERHGNTEHGVSGSPKQGTSVVAPAGNLHATVSVRASGTPKSSRRVWSAPARI